MSNPLVSIIIPVYNAERYLAETITSVLAQTYQNKEIILVDDGSADDSFTVAEKFTDPCIKILKQVHKGAAAARNLGLQAAKGEYIQFLDADDLLSPDKIEAQVICLAGSDTDLAICKTVYFNDKENHLDGIQSDNWYDTISTDTVDFLIKLYAGNEVMSGYGGMITLHSWLTPRKIIDKAGLWNKNLSTDDDGEFFCRVVLAAEGIKFSNTGLNYYRKFNTGQSLSAQRNQKAIESIILATNLKFSHLKEKTDNPIVNKIFSRHYWWTGVNAYPQLKNLSKQCIQKAKHLNYGGEKYVGGPVGHLLSNILGWKIVRLMAYYKILLKSL